MSRRLGWDRDGSDWPNRFASRFVSSGGIEWHVQVAGSGPAILLVHGTGSSTHSWRDILPRLARDHTVVSPDLPGHAFSSKPPGLDMTLPGMARALGTLMRDLRVSPVVAAGHSAGAAIIIRAAIDGFIAPRTIVSINGALLPFASPVGQLFSPLAKLLASASIVPHVMAWRAADPNRVRRVIEGTGSRIDRRGMDLYVRLLQNPDHVSGALGMMANWDLRGFSYDLSRLKTPHLLVAGSNDTAVSPKQAFKVRDIAPAAKVRFLRGLGHLAHEEDPGLLAEIIASAAQDSECDDGSARSIGKRLPPASSTA